ncbi:putative GTPase activating protein for arf domain-containing protein [Ditylenchus destructor]|nr:putative GTPase activating protein for arf domain-containing protein [Ditylenchus destructor]
MPPKLKADVKKLEADRLSAFLQEMLREEENKYCADCEAKQPRWASWNLGIFLCIRCAGLHRNLGVHISKVKSVNLDSWTPEQVQSMRVMGNAKAKAVYEAELPHLFRRPQSDQSLEAFIRAKYESKRYILKDWRPPSVNVNDLPQQSGIEKKSTEKSDKQKTNTAMVPKPTVNHISPTQTGNSIQSPVSVPAEEPVLVDLFDLSAPDATPVIGDLNSTKTSDNMDDLFGPIVSANSTSNSTNNQSIDVQFSSMENNMTENSKLDGITFDEPSQSQPTIQADGKKSNSDILALFGPSRAASQSQSMPSFYPPTNAMPPANNAVPPFATNFMSPNLMMGVQATPLQMTTATATSNVQNSGLDDLLGNFKL